MIIPGPCVFWRSNANKKNWINEDVKEREISEEDNLHRSWQLMWISFTNLCVWSQTCLRGFVLQDCNRKKSLGSAPGSPSVVGLQCKLVDVCLAQGLHVEVKRMTNIHTKSILVEVQDCVIIQLLVTAQAKLAITQPASQPATQPAT